jgi:hypothetical protein
MTFKVITVLRERLQRRQANKLPAYDRGWLAGIIDGEGCLILKRYGNNFRTCVTVTNTKFEVIEQAQRLTNLGHFWSPQKIQENCKPVFVWELEGSQVKQVLGQIILVIKEEQRKLLLEAQDLIEQHTADYTPYIERLERIRQKIHQLNRKGTDVQGQ